MKKTFILLFLIIILFGCGKKEESNEVKLCNKLDPYVEKYNKKELSFDEITIDLNNLYTEYCTEENKTCLSIKSIDSFNGQTYEIKDCSKYMDGSFKDLCEEANTANQKRLEIQTQAENALIHEISTSCALAREK